MTQKQQFERELQTLSTYMDMARIQVQAVPQTAFYIFPVWCLGTFALRLGNKILGWNWLWRQ